MPLMRSKRAALAFSSIAAVSAALFATGCAKTSPAVGTWTSKSAATLTLAADGTGSFNVPGMPMLQNKPVTWKAEDKTVTLSMGGAAGGAAGANAPSMSMPATLSDDGKTMSLKFPMATRQLTKSDGK